jgi:hypothetical protein
VGNLVGEPKEFAKTLSNDLLFCKDCKKENKKREIKSYSLGQSLS